MRPVEELAYFTIDSIDKSTNIVRLIGSQSEEKLEVDVKLLPAESKESDTIIFKCYDNADIDSTENIILYIGTQAGSHVISIGNHKYTLSSAYFTDCEPLISGAKLRFELHISDIRLRIKNLEQKIILKNRKARQRKIQRQPKIK